ncbi:serine hydrolase [Puia sp. P3]|uniref:serine hydrolase n=1 Tax=Puia sp. P3 TaxID=3423952 RepID=UPI003D6743BF
MLSPVSTRLLMKWMTESNSPHRIGGMLPKGTVVAHKTGTSNTNAAGITAATNDAGHYHPPQRTPPHHRRLYHRRQIQRRYPPHNHFPDRPRRL